MVKYTEAMVGSEISSENFQNLLNSNLYGTSYTVNIQSKKFHELRALRFLSSCSRYDIKRAADSRVANSFCLGIFELKIGQISSVGIKLHSYGT